MSQQRQRGIRATPDGIKLLLAAKGSFENGRLTYEAIASSLQISDKTIKRFFKGEGVDKDKAYAIINFLKLADKDVLPLEDALIEESIRKIESGEATDSGRAKELIEGLGMALSQLKQSEEDSLPAMEWLKANRKFLSREAAEAALTKNFSRSSNDTSTDELDLEQFSQEIRKYLQTVYLCLEEGSWEIIDGAIQESLLPITREISLYIEALTFIKDQKVNQNLPPESSQAITLCLDYLIRILPIRF
ncbi:MAG: hypothetical protein KME43_26130 [Myxacorys chilensis ATA2-1-KO14]|jgi:hypothetical protein|nr:hypothetical protein [Myxacorys chilensis ATA2-1-KO14]